MRVPCTSLSRISRTSPRSGWKSGSGAPAQASTRTGTCSAVSPSSPASVGPSSPSLIPGVKYQPATCTCERAASTSAAMRGSAATPSTRSSTELPARTGKVAVSAQLSADASNTCPWPIRARRRRWWARTARSTPSPIASSMRSNGYRRLVPALRGRRHRAAVDVDDRLRRRRRRRGYVVARAIRRRPRDLRRREPERRHVRGRGRHEAAPDLRRELAAEDGANALDVVERDLGLRVPDPHARRELRDVSAEPRVLEVLGRAGLAGRGPAKVRGRSGAVLNDALER